MLAGKPANRMKNGNPRLTRNTWVLLAIMLALLVSWGVFHTGFQRGLARRLLLGSDSPSDEFFADAAKRATDPVEFLEHCWATGKVRHRALVAALLKDSAIAHQPWIARAEPLLLACTTDADASVRELGLAALEAEHNPLLIDAARDQLNDLDPLVRMVGMEYLRKSAPGRAVPILMHSLDDPDLRIVTAAEVGLMLISGEDYGVRSVQAIPAGGPSSQIAPANAETIRRGVEKRKEWWLKHQDEYVSISDSQLIHSQVSEVKRPTAPDFSLKDLQGHMVRLSNLRGKVVLLNFWASWCTACQAEIPDLVALQKQMGARLAIIGVALDGVPDEDGDIPGEPEGTQKTRASLDAIRAKVERAVKARQITYPVVLDPGNSIGGQYNGGELPATVIIDAEGRVRRRFIGERNVALFKAMVSEADKATDINSTGKR